jgi:hypothetical protein
MPAIHAVCTKEAEITAIYDIVKRLDASLRGNGKPGLFTEFAVWKNMVVGLMTMNMLLVAAFIGLWFKS